jgi:hypothetical protein
MNGYEAFEEYLAINRGETEQPSGNLMPLPHFPPQIALQIDLESNPELRTVHV